MGRREELLAQLRSQPQEAPAPVKKTREELINELRGGYDPAMTNALDPSSQSATPQGDAIVDKIADVASYAIPAIGLAGAGYGAYKLANRAKAAIPAAEGIGSSLVKLAGNETAQNIVGSIPGGSAPVHWMKLASKFFGQKAPQAALTSGARELAAPAAEEVAQVATHAAPSVAPKLANPELAQALSAASAEAPVALEAAAPAARSGSSGIAEELMNALKSEPVESSLSKALSPEQIANKASNAKWSFPVRKNYSGSGDAF